MKRIVTVVAGIICSGLLLAGILFLSLNESDTEATELTQEKINRMLSEASEDGKSGKAQMKKARYEYFFRMLRDPATNTIPQNIRAREIRHAKTLPSAREVTARYKAKNPSAAMAPEFSWELAGPPAVGGRTRALGIDQRDPNTIIAGGVSGGIWKSIDGGDSWELKNGDVENLGVSSLDQDPNNPDVWYYTSGEYQRWSTQSAPGALYFGSGIYKSVNNGESWENVAGQEQGNIQFDSKFDFISRVRVSPTTSTVFVASNAFGITRSEDGEDYSNLTLGGPGEHEYADVTVSSNGTVAAVLSTEDLSSTPVTNNPGIYISSNDGVDWNEITPSTFPSAYGRSVLAFAPSNPNILYVLTQKLDDTTNQGVSFYRINISNSTFEDRSANLPDFGGQVGSMSLQGGYNMVVAVKPDDPDYVFVGGINLFRSTDGFATQPTGGYDNDNTNQKNQYWIGGYVQSPDNRLSPDQNFGQYPNQHADQHVIAFDPTDPDRMWAGTDGGVHVTEDVTTSPVSWVDRNEGYIVTQFYAAAIPESPDDTRLMGGTQDNGTPFFNTNNPDPGQTFDVSSGDGAYSFFSENHLFVSSQLGRIIRWDAGTSENPVQGSFSFVAPSGAINQLFVHPYTIDPNDANVMYYADGDQLWRNTSILEIENQGSASTSEGWGRFNALEGTSNYIISALEVSNQPANILYYAGSSGDAPPVIRRLEDAKTNLNPEEINLPDFSNQDGAYVHDIAINPVNANEVMVILSNYNVPSIWHGILEGSEFTWTNIEGNLNVQSIRSATMIPGDEGMVYVVGTSTGLYSTRMLEGTSTEWGQEGVDELGFSVVEQVASRISNGDVAAGTHGRGMFLGSFQSSTSFPRITSNTAQAKAEEIITLTATNFNFSTTSTENQVTFRASDIRQTNLCQGIGGEGVSGEVLSATASSIEVRVPRGILPDECAVSNSVTITANVQGQSPNPAPINFTVLPPDDFALDQNYPNPFNPTTTIPINLAVDSRVTLAIYDMLGQKVVEPVFEDEFIAGSYTTSVDLSNLASGVYIYRIVARPLNGNGETFVDTRKMTLIK